MTRKSIIESRSENHTRNRTPTRTRVLTVAVGRPSPPLRKTPPRLGERWRRRCERLRGKARRLEVVLVDVVFGEDRWRAKQDLTSVNDLQLAKTTRFKLGVTWFQSSINDSAHGISSSISEINWDSTEQPT